MRQACFACTTPYQVIGAISITIGKQLDADLYVFGMFPKYEEICERIREQNIFANVYAIDCTKIGWPNRIEGFLQMLFAEKTVSPFLPEKAEYETFYSSSRALTKTILQKVLLTRNPGMSRVIYEDGMGTYSGDSHPLNPTRLKSIAEKILGWKLDDPGKTIMMAYIPELVDVPEYLKGCKVEQMPRLRNDDRTRQMLEDIFSTNPDSMIRERYIIFDTLRPNPLFLSDSEMEVLDTCYSCVEQLVEGDDIIIKPHPRSKNKSSADIRLYAHQELPVEILYAEMDDMEKRVLISYTSSAVFTPKILFDKEPEVISLHRILMNTKSSQLFEGIYEKFKSTYSDQERVSAPESIDELTAILERRELGSTMLQV